MSSAPEAAQPLFPQPIGSPLIHQMLSLKRLKVVCAWQFPDRNSKCFRMIRRSGSVRSNRLNEIKTHKPNTLPIKTPSETAFHRKYSEPFFCAERIAREEKPPRAVSLAAPLGMSFRSSSPRIFAAKQLNEKKFNFLTFEHTEIKERRLRRSY